MWTCLYCSPLHVSNPLSHQHRIWYTSQSEPHVSLWFEHTCICISKRIKILDKWFIVMVFFWVVMLYGLVGVYNVSEEQTTSIFSGEMVPSYIHMASEPRRSPSTHSPSWETQISNTVLDYKQTMTDRCKTILWNSIYTLPENFQKY